MWDIGVDIVEIDRFRRITYPDHKRFYDRVFTPQEMEYCLFFRNPARHFAATFAGKEAVYKALNRHLSIRFKDIEILRDESGRPFVNVRIDGEDEARDDFHKNGFRIEARVSLSHSVSHAVAFAVVRFQEMESRSR